MPDSVPGIFLTASCISDPRQMDRFFSRIPAQSAEKLRKALLPRQTFRYASWEEDTKKGFFFCYKDRVNILECWILEEITEAEFSVITEKYRLRKWLPDKDFFFNEYVEATGRRPQFTSLLEPNLISNIWYSVGPVNDPEEMQRVFLGVPEEIAVPAQTSMRSGAYSVARYDENSKKAYIFWNSSRAKPKNKQRNKVKTEDKIETIQCWIFEGVADATDGSRIWRAMKEEGQRQPLSEEVVIRIYLDCTWGYARFVSTPMPALVS